MTDTPDRATLLAVADAADIAADHVDPPSAKRHIVGMEIVNALIGREFREFAAALRAKAGDGE